ncbi:uncharacterized protein PITG_22503, partial [Phytophthora infestans T30-4]
MRLFWPIRDRALSSDSEASTASQSSLGSDASFYSAADEADLAAPDWSDFRPISDDEGAGVYTFAPVSASTSGQNGDLDPPRAVPLLARLAKMAIWDPPRAVPLLGPAAIQQVQLRARVQHMQRPLHAKRHRGTTPRPPKRSPALPARPRAVWRITIKTCESQAGSGKIS